MGRIFLVLVGFLILTGCAPVVLVEGEAAPLECLPAGAVQPTLSTRARACPATCVGMGTACGAVDLGCGETAECGCGNGELSCVAGNCQCTAALEPEACAGCPGRVPRFCGEQGPKTQEGCEAMPVDVGGRRLWCCAQ